MAAKIEDEFKCPICLDLAENAVETECCNHAYCEVHAKPFEAKSCPTCRTTPFRYKPAIIVRRMINNLTTECPFCKSSNVQRGNLEDHKRTCSKRPAADRGPAPQPSPVPATTSTRLASSYARSIFTFVDPAIQYTY